MLQSFIFIAPWLTLCLWWSCVRGSPGVQGVPPAPASITEVTPGPVTRPLRLSWDFSGLLTLLSHYFKVVSFY